MQGSRAYGLTSFGAVDCQDVEHVKLEPSNQSLNSLFSGYVLEDMEGGILAVRSGWLT